MQPRIEPEICFRPQGARRRVTQDPQALLGCIEWIAHSVEIVQCHHPEWKVAIADCTADNGLHGRLVLGTPVPVEKISGLAAALPFLKVDLFKGEERKDQGIGSNVLGSPLLALAFLVEILSKQTRSPPLERGRDRQHRHAHRCAPGGAGRALAHRLPRLRRARPGDHVRMRKPA